jgi:hypothetical protein
MRDGPAGPTLGEGNADAPGAAVGPGVPDRGRGVPVYPVLSLSPRSPPGAVPADAQPPEGPTTRAGSRTFESACALDAGIRGGRTLALTKGRLPMAPLLSANAFLNALRNEGLTVVEVRQWRTHNRDSVGPSGPRNGLVLHHTVSSGTQHSVKLCYDGRPNLPGPLCDGVIDKEGVVHLVGHGRTNHAGDGDPVVLSAVTAENYGTAPPPPRRGHDTADGNAHFYGFEAVNLGDGEDPWPEVQLEAMERAAAAICRAHNWSAKSVIGHAEWTTRKIDPVGFTMPDMRARIAHRLEGMRQMPTVSLAQVIEAARLDPPAEQGHLTHAEPVATLERALAEDGLLGEEWIDGSYGTKTISAYSTWQKRCGFSGRDADGVPGADSLTTLGHRHEFAVTD